MPVFECNIVGEEKPRLVRASSWAAARSHLVTAKPISAEIMADHLAKGIALEIAGKAAEDPVVADDKLGKDPADHAPGGKLHRQAGE